MRMTGIKTDTYLVEGLWMVDVQTTETCYMAYIWHEKYGIKHLMIGMPIAQQYYEEFLEFIEENFEEYRDDYIARFFDEEWEDEDDEEE